MLVHIILCLENKLAGSRIGCQHEFENMLDYPHIDSYTQIS